MSTIGELLVEIQKRELILLEFQRGFVWSPTKVKNYISFVLMNCVKSMITGNLIRPYSRLHGFGRDRFSAYIMFGIRKFYLSNNMASLGGFDPTTLLRRRLLATAVAR